MIKLIASSVWICAVTLGAIYAAVSWQTAGTATAAAEDDKFFGGLETIKTRMLSVPVIADGVLQGHVMAQLSFTADAKLLKRLSVKPEGYLLDEAFKTIYAGEAVDFRQLKKQDLSQLAKLIVENVNKRFGSRVVEDALIDELNYVPKDQARRGPRI